MVPDACNEVWLAKLQGKHPLLRKGVAACDQLRQRAEAYPKDPIKISVLALLAAALGRKQEAIQEARRAVEILPISLSAVRGPLVSNLAMVYAWTNEPDLAFQELSISVKIPAGGHYGELKLDPAWDPLRKDPRFEKLLARLAPNQRLPPDLRVGPRSRAARSRPKKISIVEGFES
jgi:hypothetical protein